MIQGYTDLQNEQCQFAVISSFLYGISFFPDNKFSEWQTHACIAKKLTFVLPSLTSTLSLAIYVSPSHFDNFFKHIFFILPQTYIICLNNLTVETGEWKNDHHSWCSLTCLETTTEWSKLLSWTSCQITPNTSRWAGSSAEDKH